MGVSVEHRRQVVERYLGLVGTGTSEQIMELFGPDPTVEDPVGGELRRGQEAVRGFYASFDGIDGISAYLREFHAAGDRSAAFAFDVVTNSTALDSSFALDDVPRGSKLKTGCIEIMLFDDEGLVVDMKAYWTPAIDVQILNEEQDAEALER